MLLNETRVGMITNDLNGWKLLEGRINKITIYKNGKIKVYTDIFKQPFDEEELSSNTKQFMDGVENGYFFRDDVFYLNEKTEKYALKHVENMKRKEE